MANKLDQNTDPALQNREANSFRESPIHGRQYPARAVIIENSILEPIPVDIQDAEINVTIGTSIKTSGTVDGEPTGTDRVFVNNRKNQVLAAHDLVAAYSWLDFGTRTERVSLITYTSSTFPGVTITRTFAYTQVGNNYRLDTDTWASSVGG